MHRVLDNVTCRCSFICQSTGREVLQMIIRENYMVGYFDAVLLYITSICIHNITPIIGIITDTDCLAVLYIYKTLINTAHNFIRPKWECMQRHKVLFIYIHTFFLLVSLSLIGFIHSYGLNFIHRHHKPHLYHIPAYIPTKQIVLYTITTTTALL